MLTSNLKEFKKLRNWANSNNNIIIYNYDRLTKHQLI